MRCAIARPAVLALRKHVLSVSIVTLFAPATMGCESLSDSPKGAVLSQSPPVSNYHSRSVRFDLEGAHPTEVLDVAARWSTRKRNSLWSKPKLANNLSRLLSRAVRDCHRRGALSAQEFQRVVTLRTKTHKGMPRGLQTVGFSQKARVCFERILSKSEMKGLARSDHSLLVQIRRSVQPSHGPSS